MKNNIAFQNKIGEQKIYKKRRRRAIWRKRKNYNKNKQKKNKRELKRRVNPFKVRSRIVKVPNNLSLLDNTEIVLEFVQKCKAFINEKVDDLIFDFSNVTEISVGSMALFLSLIQDLNSDGITARGNLPKDERARDEFLKSGFLRFFRSIIKVRTKYQNAILVQDEGKINQETSAPEVEESMLTVFGKATRNGKLQGMIIEIMTNAVNHAFSSSYKHTKWYLSIFHEIEKNKVKFCFVDNGKGILNTIRTKYFGLDKTWDPETVIIKAFEGIYGSRTRQGERGTGLIAIKAALSENIISKLKVLTNDLFYDFETQKVTHLKNNFNGTFYFWELDTSCKNVNYTDN